MGGPKTGEGRKVPIDQCWTTHNEFGFLDGFVAGKWSSHISDIPMKQLLRMYIKHAKNRHRWGTFNGVEINEVVGHAEQLIAGMEG